MMRFIFVNVLLISFALCVAAQDTRGIIAVEFAKTRPTKGTSSSHRRAAYRRISTQSIASTKPDELSQLGLTIWRLRPAKASDPNLRIIVQKQIGASEFIPERLPANAPLRLGDNLRFSFESPQTGYLYVINRELYSDGRMSEPVLIFPTTRTRDGNNKVEAGKLIEIPAQEDKPNYFTLELASLQNVRQTGELLTVIVTPLPIEGVNVGANALPLKPEQVQQWEQEWGRQTETLDLTGGANRAWTKAEQEAGASGLRYLSPNDPEPQTIYRVAVKPGTPMLVKVGLRYGKSKSVVRKK